MYLEFLPFPLPPFFSVFPMYSYTSPLACMHAVFLEAGLVAGTRS